MARYVALLRGINVGGNNKVDMKRLKAVFEAAGMKSVKTYINSGNVVFSHAKISQTKLAEDLAKEIHKDVGFRVEVLVKSHDEIKAVVSAVPNEWRNHAEMKCDVLFLWNGLTPKDVVEQAKPREGIDDVRSVPGAVVWMVERKDVNKSRLLRIVGTPLYKKLTIRNINTTRKLLELMDAIGV